MYVFCLELDVPYWELHCAARMRVIMTISRNIDDGDTSRLDNAVS